MKRRAAREIAFQLTYEMVMTGEFNQQTQDDLMKSADADSRGYVKNTVEGVWAHRDQIKELIIKYAKGYEFDRIYKTDLAILYLSCYEALYTDTPKAVVANEAVEIAKIYSDTKSHTFINGILASVIKEGNADE